MTLYNNKGNKRRSSLSLLALAVSAAMLGTASAALVDETVARFEIAQLNDPNQQAIIGYDTVALPDGQFAVVWSEGDRNSGTHLRLQRFNNRGSTVGSSVTLQQSSALALFPQISADHLGNMVVAWSQAKTFDDLRFECGDSEGFLDIDIKVSLISTSNNLQSVTPPVEESGTPCGVDVTMDEDGDFALLWATGESSRNEQLFVQTYLADGSKAISTPFKPAISEFPGSVLMLPNNQVLLAWSNAGAANNEPNGSTVKAQKYDFLSNRIGAEFRLDNNVNGGLTTQVRPNLVDDVDGGFIAVWRESDDTSSDDANSIQVRGQRWRADTSAGAALLFGQYEFGEPGERDFTAPSIGSDSNGNVLAAWIQDPDRISPSLADATAFDGNNQLIGERQFDYANLTISGVGRYQDSGGRVAMSDDLTAIVWSEDNLRLQVRVMPGLDDIKEVLSNSDSASSVGSARSGGSIGWLLTVSLAGCLLLLRLFPSLGFSHLAGFINR